MQKSSSVPLSRYTSPTGIHGWRRRVTGWFMRSLFGPADTLSTQPLPTTGVHRILICRTSHSLGNTLLLTPLVQELEVVYPSAEIDLVTQSKAAGDIFGRYAGMHDILLLPTRPFRHPLRSLRVLRQIRRTRYDLAIDPDSQSQTGRLLLMLAKATYKLGFISPKKSGYLTHGLPVPAEPKRKGLRPVFLLRSAIHGAIDPGSQRYPLPDLRLSADERRQGRETLARLLASRPGLGDKKGVIGIFADATGAKLLGEAWWRRFLDVLETRYADYALIEIVPAAAQSMLGGRYPTYFSSNVRKLVATLSGMSLYVSADCGVMHLACAAKIPTVGIFSVTNAAEWGPYGRNKYVVDAADRDPEAVAMQIVALRSKLPGERAVAEVVCSTPVQTAVTIG